MIINLETQLDSLFSPWKKDFCPGLQVLIRHHGRDVYEKCFGLANMEYRILVTPETIFHVASISKQFTVLAALLLWKEGRLGLDDDIRMYAGDLISLSEPVTVRQLMNNVSGLRDQWELLFMRGIKINDAISLDDINTAIKLQKHLNFPPQSAYLYSNTGFHLLALIVERLSGLPFPEFAKTRIFEPLGMPRTHVRKSYGEIIPNLAYSYQDEGNGTYYYNPLNYSLYGPTSVNTCARDLSRMLDEYIRPNHIDPDILSVMKTPAILSDGTKAQYCGGLVTHELHGLTVYEHGGADAAYRGHVYCIPEEELTVILLSGTTSRLMSKTAEKAACMVLGLPDVTEPAIPQGQFGAPRAGVFLTAKPDAPQLVKIAEQDGTFYMEREYGRTELAPDISGGWRVGSLDEILFFEKEQIFYRLPSQVLTLRKAAPAPNGRLVPGTYRDEESAMEFSISQTGNGCEIFMLRYGSTPVYETADGSAAFSYGPDFSMYVRQDGDELVLDGDRVRRVRCRRIR